MNIFFFALIKFDRLGKTVLKQPKKWVQLMKVYQKFIKEENKQMKN